MCAVINAIPSYNRPGMRLTLGVLALCVLEACQCGPKVTRVQPSLTTTPTGLDFGKVKVGLAATKVLTLNARTQAPVEISSITIEGAAASKFALGSVPKTIEAGGTKTLQVTFAPDAEAAFPARLNIKSNDPDHPSLLVALAGEGAQPQLVVTLDCTAQHNCTDTVAQSPLSIDFGEEPLSRPVQVDPTTLPTVVVVNEGAVELHIDSLVFGGDDAAAFKIAGNNVLPDGGLTLGPAEGFNVPVEFKPTSAAQNAYAGTFTVTSDDPASPSVSVALNGTLRPNTSPVSCANLVRVHDDDTNETRDYSSTADWAASMGMSVNLTAIRDVRPNELVTFSATSDSADTTKCSTDAEDGRAGLTYAWVVLSDPTGPSNTSFGSTAQVSARFPLAGQYTVQLTITDSQGATAMTMLTFAVTLKRDLVVQLEWAGYADVDLDLHLVRPSATDGGGAFTGAFSFFENANNKTSGDINGYAAKTILPANAGFNFDWGQAGNADDPVLDRDEKGSGLPPAETITLNSPEHDVTCDAGCTYPVLVHYFEDKRTPSNPAACIVDDTPDCHDGEACACPVNQRCVADAPSDGGAPFGAGKCYLAPQPVVRVFVFGGATPIATIPLAPEKVLLGAPCQLWHVADIDWPGRALVGSLPDGGTPPPVVRVIGENSGAITPVLADFGRRQAGGSLACSANDVRGSGINWYSQQ